MGLIDEILHYVVGLYRRRIDPRVFARCLAVVQEKHGSGPTDESLLQFVTAFPPPLVASGGVAPMDYLDGSMAGVTGRQIVLEEMLLLSLANANEAFAPFRELFDDESLTRTPYPAVIATVTEFFRGEPVFGPDAEDLVTMLKSPAVAAPSSLPGQLEFIRTRWASLLDEMLLRLLTGIDLLREEATMRFGAFTPGPPEVYEYAGQAGENEAFSPDRDWMPRVVMLARNALVWLDQLSRRYGREIRRLDQVPDEELDRLAGAGFTALWLIGVWERSGASREIKRRMGNAEAEASAYSLDDYQVAAELGGEQALSALKDRAWRRGIRMASDMVPNHTGVDSRWMKEHPDRFLTWPHPWPPFPSYSFSGPDISQTPGLGIYLEDHYWDKTDAAVVFKRVDFSTGDTRLVYHGNDGTHMPWNDTAQLNFLNPETREAVIQTILHVARSFPIIRFDAAMTLAKKHYQRLWFPEPGRGGDIPSRAGNGLSRHDFDRAMPAEFWREVVDRIAREAPETLLLAEAFWMLEGFFVRTLGMHRVYNSAFMHMLMKEDNAGYRRTIRNTLEFDPEVLKRFVNFMSNPDEQTAIEQFGDGDKYLGVCTLMATLPGLPMFAHGQVEGFKEKYGMEFRRAYWNEAPNPDLVARHERFIFPLLRRRMLFSGVESFLLYDLVSPQGWVNEDVFAYSNRQGEERSLVLYNNRFAEARGWIRVSAAFAVKAAGGSSLVQRTIAEGLALPDDPGCWVIFRDHVAGLQFIRSCREIHERGLYVQLGAYQRSVLLDFSVARDGADARWSRLAAELGGRGVSSVDEALLGMILRPLHESFAALVAGLRAATTGAPAPGIPALYRAFLVQASGFSGGTLDVDASLAAFTPEKKAVQPAPMKRPSPAQAAAAPKAPEPADAVLPVLRALRPLRARGSTAASVDALRVLSWIGEWRLGPTIAAGLVAAGWEPQLAALSPALLSLALRLDTPAWTWGEIVSDPAAEQFLMVNTFEGVRWFSKESLALLVACMDAAWRDHGAGAVPGHQAVLDAAEKTGYRWDVFLKLLAVTGSGPLS